MKKNTVIYGHRIAKLKPCPSPSRLLQAKLARGGEGPHLPFPSSGPLSTGHGPLPTPAAQVSACNLPMLPDALLDSAQLPELLLG